MNDRGTFQAESGCLPMGSYKPPEWYSTEPDRAHNERGGLILSEDEAFSLRERLRAVEVQVDFLRKDFTGMREEMKADMKSVVESVGKLTDLVAQAKGARLTISVALMVIGALAAYAPTFLKLIWAMK